MLISPSLRFAVSAEPIIGGDVAVLPNSGGTAARLIREIGVPAFATVMVVASADLRIPLGLPGHRGLAWLAALVATILAARHRGSVIVVGAASTVATQVLHVAPGVQPSARYLAAATLLYAVSCIPLVGHRGWFVACAAAPIHLVALLGVVTGGLHRGQLSAGPTSGLNEKVLYHLAFGLAAGLLGWGVASSVDRFSSVVAQRNRRWSGGKESRW